MKHIALKMLTVEIGDQPVQISYKSQLQEILRQPADPARGAGLDEIRRSIHVLDALEKSEEILIIEDADYEYLRERVQSTRWPFVHPFILQFVEDVTSA